MPLIMGSDSEPFEDFVVQLKDLRNKSNSKSIEVLLILSPSQYWYFMYLLLVLQMHSMQGNYRRFSTYSWFWTWSIGRTRFRGSFGKGENRILLRNGFYRWRSLLGFFRYQWGKYSLYMCMFIIFKWLLQFLSLVCSI